MKGSLALFFSLLVVQLAMSQCPVLNGAMVNACATGNTEGANEFLVFTTTASEAVSNYSIVYGTTNPPATKTLSGLSAVAKTGVGSVTSSSCLITEVTSPSTIIPSGGTVVYIPADFDQQYDISGLCTGNGLYVVYINRGGAGTNWLAVGNLANAATTPRYVQLINQTGGCAANIHEYYPDSLVNDPATGTADGGTVWWSNSGVPSYNNNGCSTIIPSTIVGIIPTIPIQVCEGQTSVSMAYTVTGSPDQYNITWNAAATTAGFTDINNASLTATPLTITIPAGITAGNYTGSLIATNTTTGASSTAQNITITVNPLPVVANISGPTDVCVGSTITLSDATAGGVWSSNNSNATVDNSGVVSGVTTGSSTITYAVTNSCGTISTTYNITINDVSVVAAITGSTTVCVGSTITLSDATTGGVWSSNNSNATVDNSGVVSGVTAGLSTITYAVTNSCGTTSATYNITINDVPVVAAITGSTTVCVGSTITLNDAATGGVWSSNNSNATVSSSGVVSGVTAGASTITYAVTNPCGTISTTYNITINDVPVITAITGSTTVCVGSTITLSDATTGGVWSSNNSNATVDNSGVVNGVTAGTSTITYAVINACGTTSTTYNITINDVPTVAVITGSSTICVGSTMTLSDATTGGVWSSNNSNVSVNSSGVVSGAIVGSSTITYTVTNLCGTTSTTYNISVKDVPSVTAITGSSTVCVGSTITLNDVTLGGVWSSNNSNASVSNSGVVSGVTPGSSTITYAVTNLCGTISTTYNIAINDVPVVAPITGSSTVCVGSTITLSNVTVGGAWSSNNSNVTINSSGVISGIAVGTSIISYSVTNSCGTTTSTYNITVGNAPLITPITGLTTVCIGSTITLSNATTGGIWSCNNNNAIINSSGAVKGIIAGTSIITYAVNNTCGITSTTYNITIGDVPIVSPITGLSSVCIGSTITLSDLTAGGIWSSNNNDAAISNSGVVSAVAAGTSIISYAVTNGCGTISKTYTITINDVPTLAAITGPSSICLGSIITLSDLTVGGTWSSNNTNVTVNNSGVVSGIKAGTSLVTYTVTNTCGTATTQHTVTIGGSPLAVKLIGPTSLCDGSSAVFSAQASGGNGRPYSYAWPLSPNNNTNELTITAVSTTKVIVAVTDGCTLTPAKDSITFSVLPKPASGFTASPNVGCPPLNIKFTNTTAPALNNSYKWDFGDLNTSAQTSPLHVYTNSGHYAVSLIATSAIGCSDTLKINSAVKVADIPVADFQTTPSPNIIGNSAIEFVDNSSGATSWNWIFGDGIGSSVQQNPFYTYSNSGTYTAMLITSNENHCTDTAYRSIIIQDLNTIYIPDAFSPNGDGLNDNFRIYGIGIKSVEMSIFDRWGELVFQTTANPPMWNGKRQQGGTDCDQGTYVYLFKVIDTNGKAHLFKGTVILVR